MLFRRCSNSSVKSLCTAFRGLISQSKFIEWPRLTVPTVSIRLISYPKLKKSGIRSNISKNSCSRTIHMGSIMDSLFESVKHADKNVVNISDLLDLITRSGISLDDPRLGNFMMKLRELYNVKSDHRLIHTHSIALDREAFQLVVQESLPMLVRVMMDDFCIPNFHEFGPVIEEIFHMCRENRSGCPADYIPQLSLVDPDQWGIAVCTVDGQRLAVGDHATNFTLQSTSKPLTYAMALTELGPQFVHQHVGYEPSGLAFNHIILDSHKRPHNPLINAGALAICSILQPQLSPPDRFQYVDKKFIELAGGQDVGFNNSIFLSERATAHRNYAIAHYMKENRCFDDNLDLSSLVDFYLQVCSIEANCDVLSVMASTLANGGINPLTGSRLLTAAAARDTLSVMHSCGMYDYSGQFAFKVGLPCKSGVSGAIMVVVPDLMGIALYSPRIDKHGNSVRGIQFCEELVQRFIFHHYESQLHTDKKIDPRKPRDAHRASAVTALLFAAESNDCATLRRSYISGVDLKAVDYDGRSGLHVAASSGAFDAVKFFVEVGHLNPQSKDRWDHTPLSEAKRFNHTTIMEYLQSHVEKSDQ